MIEPCSMRRSEALSKEGGPKCLCEMESTEKIFYKFEKIYKITITLKRAFSNYICTRSFEKCTRGTGIAGSMNKILRRPHGLSTLHDNDIVEKVASI